MKDIQYYSPDCDRHVANTPHQAPYHATMDHSSTNSKQHPSRVSCQSATSLAAVTDISLMLTTTSSQHRSITPTTLAQQRNRLIVRIKFTIIQLKGSSYRSVNIPVPMWLQVVSYGTIINPNLPICSYIQWVYKVISSKTRFHHYLWYSYYWLTTLPHSLTLSPTARFYHGPCLAMLMCRFFLSHC